MTVTLTYEDLEHNLKEVEKLREQADAAGAAGDHNLAIALLTDALWIVTEWDKYTDWRYNEA